LLSAYPWAPELEDVEPSLEPFDDYFDLTIPISLTKALAALCFYLFPG